jgi:phosphoribosylaminoimidazole-succinocarboxamide synthase
MLVKETNLKDLNFIKKGKVRDIYDLDDSILLIATDRISAFDFVLPSVIPCKGIVLNMISLFWFDFFKDNVQNHLIYSDIDEFPENIRKYGDELKGRAVIVKKLKPLPFEIIVRGYITGSGWKSYKKNREISGIKLPDGLKESEKFPEPIFTPTTKADEGHDMPVSIDDMKNVLGNEMTEKIKEKAIEIYNKAAKYAMEKGIIIADTKFEFAVEEGELILIDEVLTPDSSRFWPLNEYQPGKTQNSFDKQFVRNFLLNSSWDRKNVPPPLPEDIITRTSNLYKEIYNLLTGKTIDC